MFLWLAAEVSVFLYVANEIGVGGAILLTFAASYVGIVLLRRIGVAARLGLFELVRSSDNALSRLQGGVRDGTLGALGALLLIVPGFLSDALGLLLALASARFWLTAARRARAPAADPDVIDLAPQDWHHIDSPNNLPKNS